MVFKKTKYHYNYKGDLITEFAQLLQNLARIMDDWCQDHLIAINMVPVILYLSYEAWFGSYVCLAALDSLSELLLYNEGYQQRSEEVK